MRVPASTLRLIFTSLVLSAVVLPFLSLAAYATTAVESVLYQFPSTDQPSPIIQASDGNFYGTVRSVNAGATTGKGYVFSLGASGKFTIVYNFTGGADGGNPEASLIEGNDGALYGTNTTGGANSAGVLFRVTLAGALTVLHNFSTTEGTFPGPVTQNSAGDFFGTFGGVNGAIFKCSSLGVFSIVHAFIGSSDGSNPTPGLLQASDGLVYGATVSGGPWFSGTVFRFDPSDTASSPSFTTLAYFPPGPSAAPSPAYALTEAPDGSLYGITSAGGQPTSGTGNFGTIYNVSLGSSPTVNFDFHNFVPGQDGAFPKAGLTLGGDGNLYGTTSNDGPSEPYLTGAPNGTVFQFSPVTGSLNVLYTFSSPQGNPVGAPIQGGDGSFYGAATNQVYKVVLTPAVQPPVGITFTSSGTGTPISTITLGQKVFISASVTNAFSKTMQNCWAFGDWSGSIDPGFDSPYYPNHLGINTYALTCGGVESTLATITGLAPFVNPPGIYPNGGVFSAPQTVFIEALGGNNLVAYYTTDGSTPTLNSPHTIGEGAEITVSQSKMIKAYTVGPYSSSSITTANFTIINNAPQNCSIDYSKGFVGESGLALNNGAAIVGHALQLTDGLQSEARSAFTTLRTPDTVFVSDFHFVFPGVTAGSADGMAFVLQANNPNALGGGGGDLGYYGIHNSLALKFDLHNNIGEGANSVGVYFGGDFPGLPAVDLTPYGLDLHSGHILLAHVTYDSHALTLNLTDTVTKASFYNSFPLPNPFSSKTAYAGFTAGTGGRTFTAQILDWTMESAGACVAAAKAQHLSPGQLVKRTDP